MLRLTNLMRALDARPGRDANGVPHGATRTADRVDEVYGQAILTAPSVFNFFQPDHPASERGIGADGSPLVAPERQLLTEATIASANNDLFRLVHEHHSRAGSDDDTVVLDIERPLALLRAGPEAWVDHLELTLMGGRMSDTLREILLDMLRTPAAPLDEATALALVEDSLYLVVGSPEYLVQ